jgi:hypothetical protein
VAAETYSTILKERAMKQTFAGRAGDKIILSWSRGQLTSSCTLLRKNSAKEAFGFTEDQLVDEVKSLVDKFKLQKEPVLVFASEIEKEMKNMWRERAQEFFFIAWDNLISRPADPYDYSYYEYHDDKRFSKRVDQDKLNQVFSLRWLTARARKYRSATLFEEDFFRVVRSEAISIFDAREGSIVATFAPGSSDPIWLVVDKVTSEQVTVRDRSKRDRPAGVIKDDMLVTKSLSWFFHGSFPERTRLFWYICHYNHKIIQDVSTY